MKTKKYIVIAGFCALSIVAVAEALDFDIGGAEEFKHKIIDLFGRRGGLTADEVGSEAARTSFDVAAAKAKIEAASADVDQALWAFLPKATLGGSYSRQSKVDPQTVDLTLPVLDDMGMPTFDPMTGEAVTYGKQVLFPVQRNQTTFQATLVVPLSDYVYTLFKNLDKEAAKHSRDAAKYGEKIARLNAARDAKMVYFTWIRAKLENSVAQTRLAQANKEIDRAMPLRQANKLTHADILRLKKQIVQAETYVEKSKNAVDLLEAELQALMHDTKKKGDYAVGEDYRFIPVDNTLGSLESLLEEAVTQRLELKVLSETELAFLTQAKSAGNGRWPKIDFTLNGTVANPNYRTIRGGGIPEDLPLGPDPYTVPPPSGWGKTWDATIRATWTLNDSMVSGAKKRKYKAQASEIRAQAQALKESIEKQVRQHFTALNDAVTTLREANLDLEIAEDEFNRASADFDALKINAEALIEAGQKVMTAQRVVVNAWLDQRVERTRLEYALGRVKP